MTPSLTAPFPYYGGKRRWAAAVWARFGQFVGRMNRRRNPTSLLCTTAALLSRAQPPFPLSSPPTDARCSVTPWPVTSCAKRFDTSPKNGPFPSMPWSSSRTICIACGPYRLGSLKSGVVLFLLGAWAVCTPLAEAQQATLTGWFTFIVADYPSEAGLVSETTYFLTEDPGERHELLIDVELMRPLGGPVALNRKRVTVVGEWEQVRPDASAQFWVHSMRLASPEGKRTAPEGSYQALQAPSQEAVTGSQAWVTILCRFADATDVTPHPSSHYEKLMGMSYPGLGHYWNEVSDGNLPDLNGSRVVGWYNLPRPQSYYRGTESYETEKILEHCTAAADADIFFPNFAGINLVFNRDFDSSNWRYGAPRGASRFLTLDGQKRFWGVTWLPEYAHEWHYVWAHEMGHAWGLLHSSGPYGQDDSPSGPPYDSDWDVMSGGQSLNPYPGYGHLGVHTIAYHKDFLGWIPADRKYLARPNTTQTIILERLAQPGAEGYLMAQIPIGGSRTDFYTVEARLFAGYDEDIPDEAIVIHQVDTTREDRLAQVVDVDNNGDPNDDGAMWTVGEVFTDRDNTLQVSIDAAYSSGYRVTINTAPATFSACIDTLSAPSHLFGPGRDTASVEVRAADGCGWTATSNTDWIRVRSGQGQGSGSVRYTVAANPGPTARTGTLTIDGWTFTVIQAGANEALFEDDIENGMEGWSAASCTLPERDDCSLNPHPWALTTASSHSGTQAWTDSPSSDYQNNVLAELYSPQIDLTEVSSATLVFWHRHAFASGDGGLVVIHWRNREGNREWRAIRHFTSTNSTWRQVAVDLSPFVGQSIQFSFLMITDASEGADGWYIDDIAVFSTDFVSRATLENPQPASFQSGIGIISGWACHAHEIVIELAGTPVPAAYGTPRGDTQSVCGDSNNGFSLLVNWNNLGAGEHIVRALADGMEFARTTVRVTTLGIDFLKDVRRTVVVPDFPHSGDTTTLQWEESRQNFLITDGQPGQGGGYNRVTGLQATLENPSLGSSQSGIGIISGWACEVGEIVIELAGTPVPAAYGTPRGDTQPVCGDSNNGFVLLVNWNNLGAGEHEIRALADGVEFARTTVRVTTLGVDFLRDVRRTVVVPDFPHPGAATTLQWEEALQNFVITP